MENKYEIFTKNMERLTLDVTRNYCETLIAVAQNYYSLYCQYQKLEQVRHKLANIYTLQSETIQEKEEQLDIRYRLFLEFYFSLSEATINTRNNFRLVRGYKDELEQLEQEYKLSKYTIGKHNLYKWIDISCQKAMKLYGKSQRLDLGLDNIRKAVRLYNRYEMLNIKTKEESFNEVFSSAFVDFLVNIMNTEEGLLILSIAPVRMQLCKNETWGREINSKAWKWCYEKDFRLTVSELEYKIENLKRYSKIMQSFGNISKQLNKLQKEFSQQV